MSDLAKKLAGRFLVVDGPDGAGKSTQLRLLADWLRGQGLAVTETRDPGGTAVGDRIRTILLDNAHGEMSVGCEVLLYMASRTQLMAEVIRPAMESDQCVLCDRWVSATVAYQGAGGTDPKSVLAMYELALPGIRPDLTIILDLPAETGLQRVSASRGHDRMEAKGLEFHRRVRALFLHQAREHPDRFAVADAAGSVEDVQARLRQILNRWHG